MINICLPRSAATLPTMKAEETPSPSVPPQVVMLAVPKEDFKLVNDLAEAYWIASDPNNKQAIKELRRNLLKKVNHGLAQSSYLNSNIFSTTRR